MLCPRCVKMILVIFRRFLNFGSFFGPFLGTLVDERRDEVVEALGSMSAWQRAWGREMMIEEKEQIRCLLQRLSVINRVMSSDSVVKIFEFRSYCLATYELILATWPWASISETVHRLLGHT